MSSAAAKKEETLSLVPSTETDTVIGQVRTLRDSLMTRRSTLQAEIDKLDAVLAEVGFTAPVAPARKAGRPRKTTSAASKASGRGRGARGDNKFTIMEAVLEVLCRNKKGLGRADITAKILKDLHYQTKNDDVEAFSLNVYTGGINKLVKNGEIVVEGTRPNTIYRLK